MKRKRKRKLWLFALILLPLALAIPLYSAASWRPHTVGVHPFHALTTPNAKQVIAPDYSLMASPDGTHLLSSTIGNLGPRGLAMWGIHRERVLWRKQAKDGYDWVPFCFAPDGKSLAMGHYRSPYSLVDQTSPSVVICNAATGQILATFPTFFSAQDAAFSRDGQQMTIADGPNLVVWNVATHRKLSRLAIKPAKLPNQTFSNFTLLRDGQKVLVNWVHQFESPVVPLRAELRDLNNKIQWDVPAQLTGQTLFSPDGLWLLRRAIYSPQFEVRDVKTGALMWKRATKSVRNMPIEGVWLPDSSGFVVVHGDKFLLLDARTGKVMTSVPKFPQVGDKFAISPDGNAIYAISEATNAGVGTSDGGQIQRQRLR